MPKLLRLIDSAPPRGSTDNACSLASDRERHLRFAKAGAIQQRLLPVEAPPVENAECSAVCRQAEEVGGDFYDFLSLPNGRLGLAIGDVCGKGLGAG